MCGRFHNHVKAMHEWVDILQDWPADATLGYNVSPTQAVPIVTKSGSVEARWGLVPSWEQAFATKYPTHNARLETARDKPSFRSAWNHSRTCLIPVGGFYEWRKEGSIKQPYFIYKPDDLLVFAGLWGQWNDRASFTILTTKSRGNIALLHQRMPVMLNAADAARWLSRGTDTPEILQCSSVFETINFYGVSTRVNSSTSEGPELIEKIQHPGGPVAEG
jgi:putative SOS response-associated peptidase YedK